MRVRTADAFTPVMIMDGSLGMSFPRHGVITLDLQSGAGWIALSAEGEGSSPSTSATPRDGRR